MRFLVRTLYVVSLWVCLSSLSMLSSPTLIKFDQLSTYQMLSAMHQHPVHFWTNSNNTGGI